MSGSSIPRVRSAPAWTPGRRRRAVGPERGQGADVAEGADEDHARQGDRDAGRGARQADDRARHRDRGEGRDQHGGGEQGGVEGLEHVVGLQAADAGGVRPGREVGGDGGGAEDRAGHGDGQRPPAGAHEQDDDEDRDHGGGERHAEVEGHHARADGPDLGGEVAGRLPRLDAEDGRQLRQAHERPRWPRPRPARRCRATGCASAARSATTTPVGTRPSTSGVHRPITAIAPSGTTNQPSTAADRRLRAPT